MEMVGEKKNGACRTCIKHVFVFRKGTNHLLHLTLTAMTFGVWSIIWLLVSLNKLGGWRCIECGSSEVRL
jgi:hypothetical protein